MARVKHFWVHTLADGSNAHGVAEVTWNPETGSYDVVATTERDRRSGSVFFNEGGFRGRQWEADFTGDNQFRTLREAVQELLRLSVAQTAFREAVAAL